MRAFGIHRAWLLSVSLGAIACGEETPGAGASGGAGSVSGGAGSVSGAGGASGLAGTASGGAGASASGAAGTTLAGGAGPAGAAGTPSAGGTSGSAGTSGLGGGAGASVAGASAGQGGSPGGAGAGQGGSAGSAGAGGAGGVAGTAGFAGSSGAGGTSGGGNELCTERTGGALIDVDVLGESLRFWTTNEAFIREVEDSLGEIPERIPLLELEDGTDCDAQWTFHIHPASPRFEDDWIDICDLELSQIEGDKSFYLTNRDFCPRFMRIERVDVR